MKNFILILLLLIAFVRMGNSQKSDIVGKWLVTKVESGGNIQEPYFVQEFSVDGKMVVMGMQAGSWTYDKNLNAIVMQSEMDKDFNGTCNILQLEAGELIVLKDNAKVYYSKLDDDKIAEENKKSGLEGTWKISQSNVSKFISFELPDSYALVKTDGSSTTTLSGKWMYDSNNKSLIVTGIRNILSGKNTIVDLSAEKVVINNNDNTIIAIKQSLAKNGKPNPIERLSFTEDEFFTEDGNFKYEADVEKLPWQDPIEMMMSLANVKQLVYTFSSMVENTDAFETKTLTADVNSNPSEQALSIDFIFYGYDRYHLPDDAALPPNQFDGYNLLYPEEDNTFRVVESEKITTPAGTFDCAVVEVLIDSETRKKLWMIKDKPGIYAKMINDKEGMFGHYYTYSLQAIK